MSNLPPNPLQMNIDRDGGLYDQAVEEDGARLAAQKLDQDTVFTSYDDNVQVVKKREQDEAYVTYEGNLVTTQERQQAEYEALQKKLKKAKVKGVIGQIVAASMFIPGVGFTADVIDETISSSKISKARRREYKTKNGTLLGNKNKGYSSILGDKYKKYGQRFNGKNKRIIEDLETLLADQEQRMK